MVGIVLKCLLAQIIPILGDEAYYLYWGRHVAMGYYDHPPMIGWWEAVVGSIAQTTWWLRTPIIATMLCVTFGIYRWMRTYVSSNTALLIASLWFFSPVIFLEVIVIPDIPLLFFSFFSSILLFLAVEQLQSPHSKHAWILLCSAGLLWGCGFLSKYFSVFLLPGYVMFLFTYARARWISSFFIFILGAAPLIAQHIYWNYQHCWATLFYQVGHRHFTAFKPILYLAQLVGFFALYVTLVWCTDWRLRKPDSRNQSLLQKYNFYMWVLPCLGFALSAGLGKAPGFQWYFFISPYFFIWIGLRFSDRALQKKLMYILYTTVLCYGVGTVFFLMPPQAVLNYLVQRYQFNALLVLNNHATLEKILPYMQDVDLIGLKSYSTASVFELALLRETHQSLDQLPKVFLFDNQSQFGHVFETTLNFKQYSGKNILFILQQPLDLAPYFESTHQTQITLSLQGQTKQIYLVKGIHFHTEPYFHAFIEPILKHHFCTGCNIM